MYSPRGVILDLEQKVTGAMVGYEDIRYVQEVSTVELGRRNTALSCNGRDRPSVAVQGINGMQVHACRVLQIA
jgi:hypothetical protein